MTILDSSIRFIWESWRDRAEFELGCAMSAEVEAAALDYFLDGAEPWDFANAIEEGWLALWNY